MNLISTELGSSLKVVLSLGMKVVSGKGLRILQMTHCTSN